MALSTGRLRSLLLLLAALLALLARSSATPIAGNTLALQEDDSETIDELEGHPVRPRLTGPTGGAEEDLESDEPEPPKPTKCQLITDCAECVAEWDCGWCPTSKQCTEGTPRGPTPIAQSLSAADPVKKTKQLLSCPDWEFSFCTGESCRGYKTCGGCVTDPFCGWCEGTQVCSEGNARGSDDEFCPRGWLISPLLAGTRENITTQLEKVPRAELDKFCTTNEEEVREAIRRKVEADAERAERLRRLRESCGPCSGVWPFCDCGGNKQKQPLPRPEPKFVKFDEQKKEAVKYSAPTATGAAEVVWKTSSDTSAPAAAQPVLDADGSPITYSDGQPVMAVPVSPPEPVVDADGKPLLNEDGTPKVTPAGTEPVLDADGNPELNADGSPKVRTVQPECPKCAEEAAAAGKRSPKVGKDGPTVPVLDKHGSAKRDKRGRPLRKHVSKKALDKAFNAALKGKPTIAIGGEEYVKVGKPDPKTGAPPAAKVDDAKQTMEAVVEAMTKKQAMEAAELDAEVRKHEYEEKKEEAALEAAAKKRMEEAKRMQKQIEEKRNNLAEEERRAAEKKAALAEETARDAEASSKQAKTLLEATQAAALRAEERLALARNAKRKAKESVMAARADYSTAQQQVTDARRRMRSLRDARAKMDAKVQVNTLLKLSSAKRIALQTARTALRDARSHLNKMQREFSKLKSDAERDATKFAAMADAAKAKATAVQKAAEADMVQAAKKLGNDEAATVV